jgi:MarR family transcriptional regulator, organic hydroperoxide resistance regulator
MMSMIEQLNYTTGMTPPSSDACRAWHLLMQLFFAQRANLPPVAAELELSPAQCHVLHLIEPGRPIPMGQLAETLACDASNVTGLVDRLESRGLIHRQPSAADRRVKVLDLTPTGARLRTLLVERMTSPPPALKRLSVREQRMLVRILTRLVE